MQRCMFLVSCCTYHNTYGGEEYPEGHERVWTARPAGSYGIPTLSLSYYLLPGCLLNVLWIFIIMTGILYTCCAFQYPTWKLWEMSISYLLYFHCNKKTESTSLFFACVQKREQNRWHAQWTLSFSLLVCLCVCEGHSTVPYIKLSAPQLPSSSKWSLMAWGRFVSQFWIKSRVSQALGHCFCESSNSEDKDRCLSFCRRVFVCPCTLLCCVFLCGHCIHHLQSYSVFYVVNMMHSQCQSHVVVFKLSRQMHNQAAWSAAYFLRIKCFNMELSRFSFP